ncbi:uncharacterized protein BCN122_III0604 [Burkholderia cenocepacia]|nr:uncharacterized protein BCN122_III0604 [Burkholderia cenocepacia]
MRLGVRVGSRSGRHKARGSVWNHRTVVRTRRTQTACRVANVPTTAWALLKDRSRNFHQAITHREKTP